MLHGRCASLFSLTLLLAPIWQATGAERLDSSRATASANGAVLWYDLGELGIEGKGWSETKAVYDRLPAKAEKMVREPVWNLSRQAAGLCARFVTDAPTLLVRWSLSSANLAMPHMPATGVSGVDLYVKTEQGWRWLACGFPAAQSNEAVLVQGLPQTEREYMLYLPLYNGVTKVEVGIPKEHALAKAPPRPAPRDKPIVFYGTSITQGGCASRPGMVHTAILGRRLDRPVINLGFSGNGKMEPELATLLAELDPAVYVLDCLPNMSAQEVSERVEPFVRTLRAARPATPIVLVEDRNYTDGFLVTSKRQRNEASQAALRAAFDRLAADGVEGLHYLPGKDLLGDDGEATVDSSHPTDLGFVRQAAAFQGVLEQALELTTEKGSVP
ncbi:MAG TPA: SGNH/GDSL hydrolase family protein [Pirellulales bacterium]|nr:SGNH/GDSL hydrolase family protein [Pirellulales bacterium]